MLGNVPSAWTSMAGDMLSLIVVRHEYAPLSDCCSGLNCNRLIEELEMMVIELLLTTGVLPSGGPSH